MATRKETAANLRALCFPVSPVASRVGLILPSKQILPDGVKASRWIRIPPIGTKENMNSSTSTRSNNISEPTPTAIAIPLAAVISLVITSYVIVVLVGIALRKWLFRMCCSSSDSTTDYFCDIGANCDSTGACCGNSGINCCSWPFMNCCNAGIFHSCFKNCRDSRQAIDCQPCDCCCFEIAFHLKGRQSTGSGPTL